MNKAVSKRAALAGGACALLLTLQAALAQPPAPSPAPPPAPLRATVIHWWTSGGESAAIRQFAEAFNAAGGQWVDNAIAGADQSRAITTNRILGGNAPTAAQFNTSRQFRDFVQEGLLNNVDEVARANRWDEVMPAPILEAIRFNGHYYAAPVNIHMPAWFFYSKSAFKKAGIVREPQSYEEFIDALGRLKAAGLVPLAFGGQVWQEKLTFDAIFAMVGGPELYLKVYRDRDPQALRSDAFRQVLIKFKRLKAFVDPGSPGRNWNDATAMVVSGRAGVQIMGDWAKGEFSSAKQVAGRDFGCFPGFGPNAPYVVAGDAFVFPVTTDARARQAQKLLAGVLTAPASQVAFNLRKGSIPARLDADDSAFDDCARLGMSILRDKSRQLPNPEMLTTPDVNGELQDVLTKFWNKDQSAEAAQKAFARVMKG